MAWTAYTVAIVALVALSAILGLWMMTLRNSLGRLRLAEGRLRDHYSIILAIIDNLEAPIFCLDRDYRYTSFNKGHAGIMKTIYGRDIELGRSLFDYMTVKEDREKAKVNLDRALSGEKLVEESFSGESLLSRRYFRVSQGPVRNDKDEIIGVSVFAEDITERRRAELELRRQNRELRAISACNQTMMRAEDEQSLLEEICGIICEIAGYRLAWVGYPEEDEPRSVRPVAWAGTDEAYLSSAKISWADTERGGVPFGIAIREGRSACIQDFATEPEAAPWRAEALRRGFRSSIALPLEEEDGRVFGILNIYSTEPAAFTAEELWLLEELAGDLAFGIRFLRARIQQRGMDEDLRPMNRRFTLAADAARLGFWDWDLDRDEMVWDDRMFALFGARREDFGEAREAWLHGLHPEDRDRVEADLSSARLGRGGFETEFRVLWPDGSLHHLKAYAQVLRRSEGSPERMMGVDFDITELKRSERRQLELNAELESRVRARTAELEASNREIE